MGPSEFQAHTLLITNVVFRCTARTNLTKKIN